MNKFRFHFSTWTPATGHKDRAIVVRGTDLESALTKTIRTLEAREVGIIVAARSYEKLGA